MSEKISVKKIKLKALVNRIECSACGFSAPADQFEALHSKSCKRQMVGLVVLGVVAFAWVIVGTLLHKLGVL